MATGTATQKIIVRSPFDGAVVGEVPMASVADAGRAVGAAYSWLRDNLASDDFAAHERAAALDRAAHNVRLASDELADLICAEAGKPITAARVEVARAVDTLTFSAAEARTLAGDVIAMHGSATGAGKIGFTVRRPRGVVAAITPFNFPLNLSCHKIGPAIAARCPVVHKPASSTPLTAVRLRELMLAAGVPEQMYHLVCGSGGEIGGALVDDERVAMITFTGSSDVGWKLQQQAPRKKVTLELGNSTPLLVFADADIDRVVQLVSQHGFTFAGQSCISVQRVLVAREIYDTVASAIGDAVAAIPSGDPTDDATVVGPVIDADAAQRITSWFGQARDSGARLLAGGNSDGAIVEPTVVADVTPDMRVSCGELFGPGVALTPFDNDDHAVELANGTRFGLQAGIMTNNLSRALTVAGRLEFGGVTINEGPSFRADQMPYGGMKDSGNTREGPHYAVREMTETTTVIVQP